MNSPTLHAHFENYNVRNHLADIEQQLRDSQEEIRLLRSYVTHIETERDSLAEQLRGQSA